MLSAGFLSAHHAEKMQPQGLSKSAKQTIDCNDNLQNIREESEIKLNTCYSVSILEYG